MFFFVNISIRLFSVLLILPHIFLMCTLASWFNLLILELSSFSCSWFLRKSSRRSRESRLARELFLAPKVQLSVEGWCLLFRKLMSRCKFFRRISSLLSFGSVFWLPPVKNMSSQLNGLDWSIPRSLIGPSEMVASFSFEFCNDYGCLDTFQDILRSKVLDFECKNAGFFILWILVVSGIPGTR